MKPSADLLRGALEPIILEVIADGATYGYEIAKAIEGKSSGHLLAQEGTLYPALHRLEKRGLARSRMGPLARRTPAEALPPHRARPQRAAGAAQGMERIHPRREPHPGDAACQIELAW